MKGLIRRSAQSGFTLVELLVSMAISSLLIIALLSVVSVTVEGYSSNQRTLNALSQARAFLLFFEREISTQLPTTYLIHESSEEYDGPETSDQIAYSRTLTPDEESFYSNKDPSDVTDPGGPGDIGTSFYYVRFSGDSSSRVSPKLFRKMLGPVRTQERLESFPPALPAQQAELDEPIVENVLKFTAQPKYLNPAGELETWSRQEPPLPNPVALEVTLVFLDDSTAQAFSTAEQWKGIARKAEAAAAGGLSKNFDRRLHGVHSYNRIITLSR